MKPYAAIVAIALSSLLPIQLGADEVNLHQLFHECENWEINARDFVERHSGLSFRFLDEQRQSLVSESDKLRFLGFRVLEARLFFGADRILRVELSLYNKGDAGALQRQEFEELVVAIKKSICAVRGDQGLGGRGDRARANYIVRRHQWTKSFPGLQLEYAYVSPHRSAGKRVPYNAEFIKVSLVPLKTGEIAASFPGQSMVSARQVKNARQIKENVSRTAQGDTRIANIPMVDQGRKGYCAAATSERILRYYGVEVDQHKVALLAETAAEGGTTIDGMAKAIAKIGRQFKLDVKELISTASGGSFERSDHARQLAAYNAVLRREKAKQIDWRDFTENRVVDIQAIWSAMDPEILLESRVAQRQLLGQFKNYIGHYTEQGVPLIWSCLVGLYPEEPALEQEGVFGHVRLIIGYNQTTDELLYSDSWGVNHSLKRLKIEEAWAMTKGLIVLKPRDVR